MRLTAVRTLDLTLSDLTRYTAGAHAGRLDVHRVLARPMPQRGREPDADLLAELGRRHEGAYLDDLRGMRLANAHVRLVEWAPG
jgi:hypothetical protein